MSKHIYSALALKLTQNLSQFCMQYYRQNSKCVLNCTPRTSLGPARSPDAVELDLDGDGGFDDDFGDGAHVPRGNLALPFSEVTLHEALDAQNTICAGYLEWEIISSPPRFMIDRFCYF